MRFLKRISLLNLTVLLGFAVPLVLFVSTQMATSGENAQDVWKDCRASQSCTIEYDYLSNQETDPFLFLGLVVNQEHPRWRKYKKSLRRYPDVRDCLVASEQAVETPNLLMIDWDRVGTSENASVCVFRIASSLNTIERIEAWLSYHKFKSRGANRIVSKNFVSAYETYPVSSINGHWTADQYRALSPSVFETLTGIKLVHSYLLILTFDQLNRISGVETSTRSTLN